MASISIEEYKKITQKEKKKRSYTHKERKHQIAYVKWFKKQYPKVLLVAIPNGESRDSDRRVAIIRGQILKSMGVHAGALDILIPQWHLWVEIKDIGGRLSKEQEEFLCCVKESGYDVIVAEGIDEAIAKTQDFVRSVRSKFVPICHNH